MDEMLKELVETARREDAVASKALGNDLTLLVYPASEGMLVALGYSGEHAYRAPASEVVRKRSENLRRYGNWLPAMFADGGIYVAARADFSGTGAALTIAAADLAAAEELLS